MKQFDEVNDTLRYVLRELTNLIQSPDQALCQSELNVDSDGFLLTDKSLY